MKKKECGFDKFIEDLYSKSSSPRIDALISENPDVYDFGRVEYDRVLQSALDAMDCRADKLTALVLRLDPIEEGRKISESDLREIFNQLSKNRVPYFRRDEVGGSNNIEFGWVLRKSDDVVSEYSGAHYYMKELLESKGVRFNLAVVVYDKKTTQLGEISIDAINNNLDRALDLRIDDLDPQLERKIKYL